MIPDRYGGERCVAVSMMDTYRVRHAVRDVGAALGMPLGRSTRRRSCTSARDARRAARERLNHSGLGARVPISSRLVERLDGLPRWRIAHAPVVGVLLSDATRWTARQSRRRTPGSR